MNKKKLFALKILSILLSCRMNWTSFNNKIGRNFRVFVEMDCRMDGIKSRCLS